MRWPPSLTIQARPEDTDVLLPSLSPLPQPFRDHSTGVHHVCDHMFLCPQVPSPPSPTWPRAWPGTWTGSRLMRSITTGRRNGGGSFRRAWARGSNKACPGWASACSVRGCRDHGSRLPSGSASCPRGAAPRTRGGGEVQILCVEKAELREDMAVGPAPAWSL